MMYDSTQLCYASHGAVTEPRPVSRCRIGPRIPKSKILGALATLE